MFGTLRKLCSCFVDNDQVNKQVEVKIMEIQWLLRDSKNFLDFVPDLESSKLDKLFQTDFMRSLTHEYWTFYQRKIIYKALIPWILYSVLSLIYFAEVLDPNSKSY